MLPTCVNLKVTLSALSTVNNKQTNTTVLHFRRVGLEVF